MPEAKNNRRVRFTRSALREALIDLLLEKPILSITVKDICARADINRSTFYLHYKDVTDLLRTTEDDIIEHMRLQTPTSDREFHSPEEIQAFFTQFLEAIKSMPRMTKVIQVLCSDQGDPRFVRKLQTLTYEAFLNGWDMHMMPEMDENRKLLVFSYIISGMVSMLSTWATKAGDVPTEQVVELLMGLMWHGMESIAPFEFTQP